MKKTKILYYIILTVALTVSILIIEFKLTKLSDNMGINTLTNKSTEKNMGSERVLADLEYSIEKNTLIDIQGNLLFPDIMDKRYVCYIDIFAKENPIHPERHYGFWMFELKSNKGQYKVNLSLDSLARIITARIDNQDSYELEGWTGSIDKDTYTVTLTLTNADNNSEPYISAKLFEFSDMEGNLKITEISIDSPTIIN